MDTPHAHATWDTRHKTKAKKIITLEKKPR
jgi:hypothetical protein